MAPHLQAILGAKLDDLKSIFLQLHLTVIEEMTTTAAPHLLKTTDVMPMLMMVLDHFQFIPITQIKIMDFILDNTLIVLRALLQAVVSSQVLKFSWQMAQKRILRML